MPVNKRKAVVPAWFYSPNQVASIFNLTTRTIRLWMREGKLNAHKTVGQWRCQGSDILRLYNEMEV